MGNLRAPAPQRLAVTRVATRRHPADEPAGNPPEAIAAATMTEDDSESRSRLKPKSDATGTIVDNRRDQEIIFKLMDAYIKNDKLSIQRSIVNHVEYTLARSRANFSDNEAYLATAHSVRDRLIEAWNDTNTWFKEEDPKRATVSGTSTACSGSPSLMASSTKTRTIG